MRTLNCLAIITVASLMLAGCAAKHGTSPKGLEVPIEKAAVRFSADMKEGGYKVVTTDELKKWLDDGKLLTVISTLPLSEDRKSGIIPGALNASIPTNEQELAPEDKESLLRVAGNDKNKLLVLYCGFVACRRSHIGAKLLTENGYRNVYRYPGGITGWDEAGYPLKK